jgi:AcrR family transcriptional regulator
MPNDRSRDRRVQRTRGLLHEALGSLIHEKSYDAIVVKEILGRANVGRSTFYAHFRDKDELLVSGIHEMLRAGATAGVPGATDRYDGILRFSLPIFEHIERRRGAGDSMVHPRGQPVVHERLQLVLAELVAADLGRAGRGNAGRGYRMPLDLLARHVASTFVLVLNWWTESTDPLPSAQVNDLFRALVLPTLAKALD